MAASSETGMISSRKRTLLHPLHKHTLNLRVLSQHCKIECRLCKQCFKGPTYCCQDCNFFLHEGCAQVELPPLIKGHPFHNPAHPLKLVCDERSYCCSDCGFSLGALTAIATRLPPEGVEEDTIQHFGHEEHPLSSFRVETAVEVECRFCERLICAGQVYGCRSCLFFLHEACARLQSLEIQHPLHCKHSLTLLLAPHNINRQLSCFVCSWPMMRSGPAYRCETCEYFVLHVGCAALTMAAMEEEEDSSCPAIKHHSHEHPLTPLHLGALFQSYTRCELCRVCISGAEAFACSACRFFLHKSCAEELPKEIQYPAHPQHPRLVIRTRDPFYCNTCERNFKTAFSCEDCEFTVDPVCALQLLSAVKDGAAASISHSSHGHPLTLGITNSTCAGRMVRRGRGFAQVTSSSDRECPVCHQPLKGVAYCCNTCDDLWLHRSCAELPIKLEHDFHPQHPLVFLGEQASRSYFCFACHQRHQGLACFYCAECEIYMSVLCVPLKQTLKHPRHEHSLGYKTNTGAMLQCKCCGKYCAYDSYCCMRCKFSLHHDCLHLPPTVDHKSHQHPLQLHEKFVYGDHDQYCDYCETIRNPEHGVYRCEECNFSAHIECIVSNYKGEAKGSETWGSDKDNQLDIEIASRKAKIVLLRRDLKVSAGNLAYMEKKLLRYKNWDDYSIYEAEECVLEEDENEYYKEDYKKEDESDEDEEDEEEEDDDKDEDEEDEEEEENDDKDEDEEEEDEDEEDEDDDEDEDEDDDKEHQKQGLKHPCHEHPLVLRILSMNCQQRCRLCWQKIHGPTYCCEDCNYFVHGKCALIELPPKIRHPSHPHHLLTLFFEGYKCRKCRDFKLNALTAVATMPPQVDKELNKDAEEAEHIKEAADVGHDKEQKGEMGIIRHFAHKKHPLASFYVEITLPTRCDGCLRPISGQVYGCRACNFLLHALCAQAPLVIDHHPLGSGFTLAQYNHADQGKCAVCEVTIRRGLVYKLSDGSRESFRLHMVCALSTRFPPGHHSAEFKLYSWHSCPLVLIHIEEESYAHIYCKVCEIKISGLGRGCLKCRLFLHNSCAEKLSGLEVIKHFLHPEHPKLVLQAQGESLSDHLEYRCCCKTCQTSLRQYYSCPNPRMAFQCDSCECYLNPKCALQTLSAVENGAAASISYFAHDHPMLLHSISDIHRHSCMACRQPIEGLAYCCPTCESIELHISCAELPKELEHPFHSKHVLLLSKSSEQPCRVCCKRSRGYAYYCPKCEFYLDVRCASLSPTLKHPRHEHKLAYLKQHQMDNLQCNVCEKRCKKDFYLCAPCGFSLHHDCLPLPPKIKHQGHVHPVFLKDKFVYGNPDYQYCDHCEELRNPEHGVYHCEECWFSAHIDCMIPKEKVEEEDKATVVEAKGMEVEQDEVKTSVKPVAEKVTPETARLMESIDVLRRNVKAMGGSFKALKKELQEFEMEKDELCD